MRLPATCLLLSLALPVCAQIYQSQDANGNTVYSNQPAPGQNAEPVVLPPTNRVDLGSPERAPGTTTKPTNTTAPAYRLLKLSGLPDDQALRANNGTFSVDVQLDPELAPGHRLRLLLDGKPHGQPSTATRLQVSNADRGEHSLAVEVLRDGQAIQQSRPVTFTVQRVHLGN